MSVREQIGAFAAPDVIHWAPGLPKTRSGKIMRRGESRHTNYWPPKGPAWMGRACLPTLHSVCLLLLASRPAMLDRRYVLLLRIRVLQVRRPPSLPTSQCQTLSLTTASALLVSTRSAAQDCFL